jgi:hypothetical protein
MDVARKYNGIPSGLIPGATAANVSTAQARRIGTCQDVLHARPGRQLVQGPRSGGASARHATEAVIGGLLPVQRFVDSGHPSSLRASGHPSPAPIIMMEGMMLGGPEQRSPSNLRQRVTVSAMRPAAVPSLPNQLEAVMPTPRGRRVQPRLSGP